MQQVNNHTRKYRYAMGVLAFVTITLVLGAKPVIASPQPSSNLPDPAALQTLDNLPLPALPSATDTPAPLVSAPAPAPLAEPLTPSASLPAIPPLPAAPPIQAVQTAAVGAPAPLPLPNLMNGDEPFVRTQEEREFFQPGLQLPLPGDEDQTAGVEQPVPVEKPVAVKRRAAPKPPPLNSFNYKTQYLPWKIYNKNYSKQNIHLPKAVTMEDYDMMLANAVARNDINSTRALVEAGHSVQNVAGNGDPLVVVAARHNATTVLRYLLSKGANPWATNASGQSARDISRDPQVLAALQAAGS